jgi:hypothetical protein
VLLLVQNEQTRSDLPAFVNLFKARSVGSNMFVDRGMTRLMVMAMEDRCGRLEDSQRVTYTYTVSADVTGLLSV